MYNEQDVDNIESQSMSNHQDFYPIASNYIDTSTCGGLHSIGSDMTHMRIRANSNEHSPMKSEQTTLMRKKHGNTPTNRAQPEISRESYAPGNDENRANTNYCDEDERMMCSCRSTQDKCSRKTSMVKEPILQYTKC